MSIKNLLPVLLPAMLLASCSKNDEPTPKNPGQASTESILFAVSITNAEGNSGSVYMQSIPNLEPASYDNRNSIPTGFGATPIAFPNGHIYAFPDYLGNSKAELKRYAMADNNKLALQGVLSIPAGASACNVVELNEEKAYLSCQGLGLIIVFNPKTMKQIKQIDLSSLSHTGTTVSPAAMIIRDKYLYVGLSQFDSQWMPTENSVELALINTDNDQYEKTIRNTSLGVSVPTRPIESRSIFMDEKGDIYINCVASFGFKPGFPGGVIRIKKGQTEIDPDYCIRLDQTKVAGLSTQYIDYLGGWCYDKDGKVYAYANSYQLDPQGTTKPYSAMTMCAVVIDLYNKTIQAIPGLPLSNPHGIAVGKYKDQIVFGSANKDYNGFYTYNPATGKASAPIVKVQGFPSYIYSYAK